MGFILLDVLAREQPGLGPTNENTLKDSLISCLVLRFLKLLTNISN
jgi:hypothetical protein